VVVVGLSRLRMVLPRVLSVGPLVESLGQLPFARSLPFDKRPRVLMPGIACRSADGRVVVLASRCNNNQGVHGTGN